MNTPTHALLNLALLSDGRAGRPAAPVLVGALLPDLPMFGFWLWQSLARGNSQQEIWSRLYFEPFWQQCFDAFNSIPVYALVAALAFALHWRTGVWFAASALLHVAFDLPLHREDAHAHFWPFSSWHFVSAVSYWDRAHHGLWVSLAELVVLAGCALQLAARSPGRPLRLLLGAVVSACAAGWVALFFFA